MSTMKLYLAVSVLCAITSSQCFAAFGGWKSIDENGQKAQDISRFAVQAKDSELGNLQYQSKSINVIEASSQVVSGMMYKLVLSVGESNCGEVIQEECSVQHVETCTVQVHEKEWLHYQNLESFDCVPALAEQTTAAPEVDPGRLVGGPTGIDTNSPEVQSALSFAVSEMNARRNSMYRMVPTNIISATSQVVQGVMYTIVMETTLSTCRNNGATIQDCPAQSNAIPQTCTVKIWSRSWLDTPMELTSENCADSVVPQNVNEINLHSQEIDGKMSQNQYFKDQHYQDMFENFKLKYNKQYGENEESDRFEVFKSNMKIAENLQKNEQGTATYGATMFADISPEDFRRDYLSPTWDTSYDPRLTPADIPDIRDLPEAFDWRDHGAVTEVKNQGACGSCWAFSTTGNIEGQWAAKAGQPLLSLSEQELVDCDKLDEGCMGGLPSNAYSEIMRIGGLETEEKYPYDGHREKCQFNSSLSRVRVSGALNISSNEDEMAAWLVQNGPISIGINAFAMQFYFGGVSHPFKFLCNPASLDHGVLIVGYGVKNGLFGKKPYWIVKNSWGPHWGVKGYYLVYRGKGVCGLNTMCTSAVVDAP